MARTIQQEEAMNITIGQPECPEPITIWTHVFTDGRAYRIHALKLEFPELPVAIHTVAVFLLECPSSRLIMLLSGELKGVATKLGLSVKTVRGYQFRNTNMPRTTRLLCLHLIGFKLKNDIWCLTSE